jgi:hypothetical protein
VDERREAAHGEEEERKCLLFVGTGECKQISSDSANFFDISRKLPILMYASLLDSIAVYLQTSKQGSNAFAKLFG